MDAASNNHAERVERIGVQPYFAITTTIGMVACCCFAIKGIIVAAKAHSTMGAVAGVGLTLFSLVLLNRIQKINDDRIHNRSIEELRNTRGSPVQQIADALSRIGTFGLKDKFFTAFREKAHQISARPFFSATCLSIICLSTISAGKGLMLTAVALSPSTPIIAIISNLSLPLISGGLILVGLSLMASRFSSLAGIGARARSPLQAIMEIHRTKLSAVLSVSVGLGGFSIVMGICFAALSSSPLALLAARVGLVITGLTLTVMGFGYLDNVCKSLQRSLENLPNIPAIDQVIEAAYTAMWPDRVLQLPAIPYRYREWE